MIDKTHGVYELECDVCGESPDETFDDFEDAVNFKREQGWKSRKIDGEWCDLCPGCVAK